MGKYYFGIYLIIAIFEIYMLGDFGKNILGICEISYGKRTAIFITFVLLLTGINSFGNTTINLIGVPIIYLVFIIIRFKNSIMEKILAAFCFYMLIIGPEFIFAMINQVNQNVNYQPSEMSGINTYIMLFIMKSMTFVMVKCIGQIHKSKKYSTVENDVFIKLLILPLATIFLFLSIFYADIKVTGKSVVMLSLGVAFLLFSNIYMFYIFDKLIEVNEKAQKMRLLSLKSNVERRNYQKLEKINHKNRIILHDVNKYLRTAVELAKTENSGINELYEKVGLKLKECEDKRIARNSLLNAILMERGSQAEDWNIRYDTDIDENIIVEFLDELDLIAILGNLLDNALEAANLVKESKYVLVRMYMSNQEHFLCVEVENNFKNIPVEKNNRFITIKENKSEHGFGLHTVENLVQKYNGLMQTKIEKNVFKVAITIPINKV